MDSLGYAASASTASLRCSISRAVAYLVNKVVALHFGPPSLPECPFVPLGVQSILYGSVLL